MARSDWLILLALAVQCVQFKTAAAQNDSVHPVRLATEVVGAAFHLWSPETVRRNFADDAIGGGAGIGILFYEDFYVGSRMAYGQFDRIDSDPRETGGEMYFFAGEAIGRAYLPRTGSDAASRLRIGPIAIRLFILGRAGIHVVGIRAGSYVDHLDIDGSRSRHLTHDHHAETRISLGGGGGVEFRYGRQTAFFIDATYSIILLDDRTYYTPLSIGLRVAGGPP